MSEKKNETINTIEESLNLKIVFSVFVIIALGIRLYVSWLDEYILFQKCVVDDAYFYIGIAKNIANGVGTTFDGNIMTNGFHPVFALLLVPIYWIFPGNMEIPIHIALTILSFFNVSTGIVVFLILREISGRLAGLAGLFIWLFNPYVIMISLNGVESGVAVFFQALCIYYYIRFRETGTFPVTKLIVLGFFTAMAVLSRIDSVFLFVVITLDIFYLSLKENRNFFKSIYHPSVFAITTFAFLSPWFIWNLIHFGTIRQISGVSLPNIAHNMYLMKYKTYVSFAYIKHQLSHIKVWAVHIIKYSGGIGLFLLFAIAFTGIVRKKFFSELHLLWAQIKRVNFSLLAAILLVCFYALYFWGWLRPWYYLSVILIVTLYFGMFAGRIQKFILSTKFGMEKPGWSVAILIFCLCVYFSYQGRQAWTKGLFTFQKQLYDSALWLKDNTEKDSTIGAISAGIYGHITQRTIDLAGVVNEEAYQAMRKKHIFSYLKAKKIDYLVDRVDMIQFYQTRFDTTDFIKKLKMIKKFGDKPSDIVVYRIPY